MATRSQPTTLPIQVSTSTQTRPYLLDFYCPGAKLAVECDGQPHFTPEGIEEDQLRTQWLNRQGFEVIRLTSNEIENDTQSVLLEIDLVLTRSRNQDTPPHPPAPSPPAGGEGEIDHQPLRDFPIAYPRSRSVEQKLRKRKLLHY